MYALFQKIKEFGIGYAERNRDKLSSLECAELLLHDPATIGFVPFERMTGLAWYYFLRDDRSNSKAVYDKIPWCEMSAWVCDELRRHRPELVIPNCGEHVVRMSAENELFKDALIIDPQSRMPMLRFVDFAEREVFDKNIAPFGVMDMLKHEDYVGTFLTCSCGVPDCAGLESKQYSHLTPSLIHWSIKLYGKEYELYFDRQEFEDAFACILSHLLGEGMQDKSWDDAWWLYDCCTYEMFYERIKGFAEGHQHLKKHLSAALMSAETRVADKNATGYKPFQKIALPQKSPAG